ncbi:hypothetical protein R1sor_018192 [Riccia sorocarpa]|uniref:RING-type domain-containing protein n=1 Tax=Riccia sorocarpa TaxID=122646 RepID=A0ABD3I8Z3_9MARC
MAPKTRNVSRKRKERSPIVEFPPEDAEELIDLTVSKIVETAEEGESSKHNEATAASTAIEVYRLPGALQTLDDFRGVVTLEELSLLERDEVYPYLDLSHLEQDKGFVNISSALFSRGTRPGIDVYPVDLSDSGLKRFVDFPAMGPCSRVVPGSVIEKHFLDQLGCDCLKNSWEKVKVWFDYTGSTKRNEGWNIDELRYFAKSGRDPALDKKCKLVMRQALKTISRTSHIYCSTTVAFLAIAHVDHELENMRPDWHAWCANEIRFRLRHSKTDKHSKAKFREGWQAIVELVTRDFLAKQAARLQQQSSMLQLEYSSDAKNAFAETKVVRDAERGELIAERERLRTELKEAQSREEVLRQERWQAQEEAMQAEMREGALRHKHEMLQREYSSQKEEWEARNQKLSEDISVLHEERLRITAREDNVQAELAQIRGLLLQPRESSDVGDVGELKKQLEEKEEQLKRLAEADAKVVKKLRLAKKKGQSMEKELSKMPAGLMVKAETKTLDILKSGRKWEVSLYPLVFDCNDSLTGWKEGVPPVPCAFCRGMISPGTDLRIPNCGHSYHVSCVCSCFGVNFLVCWEEQCSASIPLAWVKEFCLVRELDLKALHERLLCSVDMRSLPPSQFGDSDDLQIVGIPTMRLQKKKYLDSLHQELSDKTCAFIRSVKQGSRLKLYPPPHRVTGTQFRKWSQMEIGVKMIEWTHLWDYPSNKCWIFSAKCTPGETTCHNRALVTMAIDVPRGDDALQMLCKINMALCIRLRP